MAETDVLAYISFPLEHRVKLHSANGLERLRGEVKRRTDVVGVFPNDEAIFRVPSCWNRMTNGRVRSADTSPWKPSPA